MKILSSKSYVMFQETNIFRALRYFHKLMSLLSKKTSKFINSKCSPAYFGFVSVLGGSVQLSEAISLHAFVRILTNSGFISENFKVTKKKSNNFFVKDVISK